jgi:hypothetical protein
LSGNTEETYTFVDDEVEGLGEEVPYSGIVIYRCQ